MTSSSDTLTITTLHHSRKLDQHDDNATVVTNSTMVKNNNNDDDRSYDRTKNETTHNFVRKQDIWCRRCFLPVGDPVALIEPHFISVLNG